MKRIRQTIRGWNLPRQTSVSLNELARRFNAHIRGWMNYYGHFYKSALYRLYNHIDAKLVRWAQRKYRKLAGRRGRKPGLRQWLTGHPGCLFTGPLVEELRHGQWEPCESRNSRTVLREALGEIPGAYSPVWDVDVGGIPPCPRCQNEGSGFRKRCKFWLSSTRNVGCS